jgi:hypothetical protein
MRFYTRQECEEWLRGRERVTPDQNPDLRRERISFPQEAHEFFYLAHWIATSLTYREPTLLWITEWSVWPSSENWHLYYKLRRSYGDTGLLHESPGHLFLQHEAEDLASFLQLSMLNGWGGYVLPHLDYVSAFFSHDEFIDFFAQDDGNLTVVREAIGGNKKFASRLRVNESGEQVKLT